MSSRPADPTARPRAAPHASVVAQLSRLGALILCLGVLGLLILVSISVGAKAIPLGRVWTDLLAPSGAYDSDVVHTVRLARTLTGVVVGCALGLAGALMQALTRNPLADPGVLGVNAGAFTGVIAGIALLGVTTTSGFIWFAFAGAAAAAVLVYALGSRGHGGASPARLALAGTALTAALTAVTSTVTVIDIDVFNRVRMWNLGSIAVQDSSIALEALPFVVAGGALGLSLGPALNAIALGDELGRAVGAHVTRTRVLTALAVTLLCGAATAAAGPIGFVGLMVPHLARALIGPDQRWVLPYSMVLAAILLLAADVTGRVVARPGEVEVGVVTALLGAPVLVLLARRRKLTEL